MKYITIKNPDVTYYDVFNWLNIDTSWHRYDSDLNQIGNEKGRVVDNRKFSIQDSVILIYNDDDATEFALRFG